MISKEEAKRRIKELSIETGLSIKELSVELGYKTNTISQILSKGEGLENLVKRIELYSSGRKLKKSTYPVEIELSNRFTVSEPSINELQLQLIESLRAQVKLLESNKKVETDLEEIKSSLKKMEEIQEAVALVVHESKHAAESAGQLTKQLMEIVKKPTKSNT